MLEVKIKKSLPGFSLEVDFSVNQEILAILGPSGSGKTMTLQCIAGLVKPDEGHIKLNDKVLLDTAAAINLKPQTRRVGFVFQNYALFPHLNVRDNIAYGIRQLTKKEVEDKVTQLLEKMHIQAQVKASYGELDDVRGTRAILVDITGKDLSILIGKRSETLNALQYIARLIVSKELGENVTLVIDVEGYRSRRERQLRQLAHRMAEQAIKTGRKQTLEPMPPNERRIIHMELRQDVHVSTESYGEEPHRKVTIIPKE